MRCIGALILTILSAAMPELRGQEQEAEPQPGRRVFQARASELDPRTREHPEIGFIFGEAEKPEDVQRASYDPNVPPRGELVIWLMGHNDELFRRINGYGQHAIQVHYANKWFGLLCQPEPSDSKARGNVRLEAATGQNFSDELELGEADGMMERARQFLLWLDAEDPDGGWGQFLDEEKNGLRWDKVVVAGASHGATTAARLAMYQEVARVVMLCGPRDQDQDWQADESATPRERYFGFSHVLDSGWVDDHYCRSWELLGLHQYGPVIEVEKIGSPYGRSRRLVSAADVGGDANRAHSAVTPGKASPKDEEDMYLYEPVWEYLFTHPAEEVGESVPVDPDCKKDH
jgi:hypothetical protein